MTEMTQPNATNLQQEELELEELMWHTQVPKTRLYEPMEDETPPTGQDDPDHRRVA